MPASLDRARDFILRNARTLDRRRYEHHFEGAPAESVLAALGAYRNPDGGFGHALEADLRTSDSQPLFCEVALAVMHEVDAGPHPWAHEACDFLGAVAQPDGAVRTILPSALEAPRAAHWQIDNWAEDSPNPTAGIAGALHALGVTHPWLDRATDWMWRRLDGRLFDEAHDLLGVTTFLSHVPDRSRAGDALANAMAQLPAAAYFLSEPSEAYGLTALTFAPTPEAPTRPYLDDRQIDAHLDALESDQQEDGGWPIAWTPPGNAAIWEWRGTRTLEALRTLSAWNRL